MNDNEIYEILGKNVEDNIRLDFADVLKRIDEQKKSAPVEIKTERRRKWIAPLASSLAACAAIGIALTLFFAVGNSKLSDSAAEPTNQESGAAYADTEYVPNQASVEDVTETADCTDEPHSEEDTPQEQDEEYYSTSKSVISAGTYSVKADDGIEHGCMPFLRIDIENGSFSIYPDVLSSYMQSGEYSVEGNKLICRDAASDDVFNFTIVDSEQLIFLADGSASVFQSDGTRGEIADGTVFELEK